MLNIYIRLCHFKSDQLANRTHVMLDRLLENSVVFALVRMENRAFHCLKVLNKGFCCIRDRMVCMDARWAQQISASTHLCSQYLSAE